LRVEPDVLDADVRRLRELLVSPRVWRTALLWLTRNSGGVAQPLSRSLVGLHGGRRYVVRILGANLSEEIFNPALPRGTKFRQRFG
jgi:hypothetical protein